MSIVLSVFKLPRTSLTLSMDAVVEAVSLPVARLINRCHSVHKEPDLQRLYEMDKCL